MKFFKFKNFKLDFLIIGVQKAGTSALDQYLRQQPDIEMANIKELHFFDNDHLFEKEKVDYSAIRIAFGKINSNKIYGESTPSYIYWNNVAERIKEYNPRIKLIAILRNPVDRAFSHWNMEIAKNKENRSFQECIKEEILQIRNGNKKQSRITSYVERGQYFQQIKRLYSNFSKDQVLFVKYEDFLEDQEKTVEQVCYFISSHLGKNITFNPVVSNKIEYTKIMQEEEEKILYNFFREDVEKVEKLLNWNCGDWKNK